MPLLNKADYECDLSEHDFKLLKELMYKETGVFLKPSKRTLVLARLRSRLKELSLDSFSKYYKVLENPLQKSEREFFINSITTNETYFNRNETQFNYLKKTIIPKYIKENRKNISIWSSASSTGEEAYTIAMILLESIPNISSFRVNIYASDINSDVIKTAKKGVYSEEKLRKLPALLKKKYFTQKEDQFGNPVYELSNKIRSMVTFFKHNLLHQPKYYNLDVVFLSNVLIYFDATSKQKVINNISRCLKDGGYLFLGGSESLMGLKYNFKLILPSSFKKENSI